MAFAERLRDYQSRVEAALESWLPPADQLPRNLHEAMRYAVLGGGKRIRPVIVYASGEAFGAPITSLDGPACAVEVIHAYSLVHDDLPAMDNDDLRRGRPTCHRAFGEATAILAGDALQALAFAILAGDRNIHAGDGVRVRMTEILASASGSLGMAGGQAIDLSAVGHALDLEELETMHRHKTGALIRASAQLGALAAGEPDPARFEQITRYAQCIGLAFQIHDDVLDVEVDTETLGKPQGSDEAHNKPTYPQLLGLDGAKRAARRLRDDALDAVRDFDERANGLRWLANYIVERGN